jgi:DNA-binding SARP family transcriptional activator/tetratricopeptide (TPR) repeat protein/TolB-like protein
LIRLYLLGGLRLEGETAAGRRSVLSQPRRLALLAFLVLRAPRGALRRDELLGIFWPESDTAHARGALRNALHFLRLALGPGVIHSRGSEEIELQPGAIWCDAVEFDRLLDAGDIEGAVALYAGDLLVGLFISDAPDFEHWLDAERDRLRRRAAHGGRTLAEAAEAGADLALAAHRYRRVLELAPTDEPALRGLMRVLAAADDRGDALGAYEAMRRRLEVEYGLVPSAETTSLAQSIRATESPAQVMDTAGVGPAATRPYQTAGPSAERVGDGAAESAAQPPARLAAPPRRTLTALVLAAVLAAVLLPLAVVELVGRSGEVLRSQLVAVLPFGYRGTTEHAWLGESLADLLAANLDGAGELRTVDPRALLPPLQAQAAPLDPAAGRRAAAAHGADRFVLGTVTESGGRLRINAALYGDEVHDVVVEGDTDELLALVDRLTLALLEAHGGTSMPGRSAARATHVVAALKSFMQGEAALRRMDTFDALGHFRRATELDSTFALAHYRLSSTARWEGVAEVPLLAATAALRHSARLLREDSLLVAAWYHHVNGSVADAYAHYQRTLQLRPGHVEAAFQLGELLFHWGSAIGVPASESRAPFSSVLAAEPGNVQAALHLVRVAARDGRTGEVDSLLAHLRRLDPEGSWRSEMDALRAFLADDPARQAHAIRNAGRQPNRDRAILERMAAFSGNLAAVERVAAERVRLERTPLEQARMQLFLAHVQVARGRFREAEQTIASSVVLPPARRLEYRAMMATLPFSTHSTPALLALRAELAAHSALPLRAEGGPFADFGIEYPHLLWPGLLEARRLYLLGALHVRLGDLAGAMAVADSLGDAGPTEPLALPYERLTCARLHAAGMSPVAALRALGLPQPPPLRTYESLVTHGRPYERWLRAELLRETGRGAEAIRWYATFPDPVARDLPYLALSHLRRAGIHDTAGDAETAAWHYHRFIGLWADADAELQPEVERARSRLAELELGHPAAAQRAPIPRPAVASIPEPRPVHRWARTGFVPETIRRRRP